MESENIPRVVDVQDCPKKWKENCGIPTRWPDQHGEPQEVNDPVKKAELKPCGFFENIGGWYYCRRSAGGQV